MKVKKLNESTKYIDKNESLTKVEDAQCGVHYGKQKVNEDKGQTRSKRYTTYFNRIKRAIEEGDEETLQRTKEAIMYAPAKELKNSEASKLMSMIKNRTINAPHNKEVNEGIDGWDNRTGVIKRIDKYLYDNPEAIPPKGYIQPGSRAYDDAVSRYGDYVTTPFGNISTDDLMQYARDNKLLKEATQPKGSIDVATIADYITDHYDFDDIDDKYSCINSIKDSFKNEPTISYEELEQFIGAHNGKDKVNESKSIKEDNKLSVNTRRYRSKANESADRFQKEFYKGYVILRNRGGDGWDIYSYEGTPELEDEGYASLKAAKAEIDKWVKKSSMDESCFSINNKTFRARKKLGKRLLPQNENYGYEEDNNFFNKEELIEFGEEIVEHLNKIFDYKWELTGAYEDGKEIEIEVTSDDIGTYVHSVKVDFRKIKRPSDINKYIMAFVAKFNEQIRKDTMLNESLGGEYANKILEFAKRSLDKHYDIIGILEVVLRYCPEDILRDAWYDKISSLIDDTDDFDLLDDSDPRVAMQDESLIESASEDIPTETLAGPEAGPAAGLAELISAAIKDEWSAIETYNTLSISARAEGFEGIAKISDEIGTEENKHIGQLQEALKTISPNTDAIAVGQEEGKDQLNG